MKQKLLFVSFILLCYGFILDIPRANGAIVSDECEACHGLYPGMLEEPVPGEPAKYALQNVLCVNCHSHNERDTIKMLGGVRVPVVFNTVTPVNPLAGGNFYYVSKDFGDRRGHNVDGITLIEAKFMGIPPGYDRESDPSVIGYNIEKPLTCAGSNGCHGNRNVEEPFAAIRGAHHADDSPMDGVTISKSYRYLKNTDKVKGVLGLEDADWGQRSSSKKHNEYSLSIDNLCANCHGNFHRKDKIGKMSPWLRHPTGVILPKSGEYANYNPEVQPPSGSHDMRIYSLDAPVARPAIPNVVSDIVTPGKDLVTCLSCHVAHSSPHESILRWDYDAIISGETGGGCIICHTEKGE